MTEKKPHVWEVDAENFVHTRWCPEAPKAVQPYYTGPKTAIDLLTQIAAGDSQAQFGNKQGGPCILTPCAECVLLMAETEREDLP